MKISKIVFLSLGIIICSIFIIPIQAEVSEEDGKLFADAIQLLKEKKFQSALIKTQQFLNSNPDNFEAKSNECSILLELKRLSEAEECLVEVLAKNPEDTMNSMNLGVLYLLQKNYNASKTQLSVAHQLDPDNITTYANLLAARVLVGEDIEQIIQEHEEILTKDEFNVQVLTNLAKILTDKQEFDKAKYFIDRAYEINSEDVNVLEQLGVWYALQGDFQNAENYFLRAYNIDSENISVLNNLGLLYRERGDKFNDISMYYNSIGYYQSVLLLEPDNVFANIGVTYSEQKIQELYQKFYFQIYLIVILGLSVSVVTIFLWIRDLKKLEKDFQTLKDYKGKEKLRKKIIYTKIVTTVLSGILTIASAIIIISLIAKIPLNNGWDMANWTSTIVEIGIGVMIAVVILVYELSKHEQFGEEQHQIKDLISSTNSLTTEFQNQQKEVNNLIKNIENYVTNNENRDKKNREYLEGQIIRALAYIRHESNRANEELERMHQNASFNYETVDMIWNPLGKTAAERLSSLIEQSNGLMEATILDKIDSLKAEIKIELGRNVSMAMVQCIGVSDSITRLFNGELKKQTEKVRNELKQNYEKSKKIWADKGFPDKATESQRLWIETELKKYD